MKRTLLAFGLCALLFACKKSDDDNNGGNGGAPAGPSLVAADVTRDYAPNKTLYYYTVTGNAGGVLTVPAAGSGQTWNFGNIPTNSNRDTTVLSAASNAGFGTATYSFTEKRLYGSGTDMAIINITNFGQVSAAGWQLLGRALPAFTLGYPSIGGSLAYSAQNATYTPTPLPMTPAFPVEVNDSVTFNTVIAENSTANAPGAGVVNAATSQRTTYAGKVKAIGTGATTLPGYAAPLAAMVLRRDLSITDNYFLNGVPANPLLLQALGLTDGATFAATCYDFYNYGGIGYLGTIVVQGNAVAWARFRRAN